MFRSLSCSTTACAAGQATSGLGRDQGDATTHFGFQTVKKEEKERLVGDVFHKVASQYNKMNDVMSMGIHRIWKDMFMDRLKPNGSMQLVDVAGGTGDVAFRFLNATKDMEPLPGQPEAAVTVVDINSSMLEVGKQLCLESHAHSSHRATWVEGNAEYLPLEDNSMDAYTIAFGIRNCTNIDAVLRDAFRVLKPGGRFLCLEFSRVENAILREIYRRYSFEVIPVMGLVVSGDYDSYQYLVESIERFPDQHRFAHMIRQAGFRAVTHENCLNGIAAIHSGFKLCA